jgi:hypothetical protein
MEQNVARVICEKFHKLWRRLLFLNRPGGIAKKEFPLSAFFPAPPGRHGGAPLTGSNRLEPAVCGEEK